MDRDNDDKSGVSLSLVVPLFNEREVVERLIERIDRFTSQLELPFEVILVDDGSSDGTAACVAEKIRNRSGYRLLRLKRNYGQSTAIWAGFEAARGEIIATIDGDLQNEPCDLLLMLPLLKECDCVVGVRVERQDNLLRRLSGKLANWVRRKICKDPFRDTGCGVRVFRRRCLQHLFPFNGIHRWLPVLLQMMGYEVREIPVRHFPRPGGSSKYGVLNRLWRGLVDLAGVSWMKRRAIRYEIKKEE